MQTASSPFEKFFGVVVRGRTYLNALYLLLSFPLGLFYFVFLVTGIALGIPLIIVWVGLLILVGVFAAWYGLAAFERWQAIALLGENIPPMSRQSTAGQSLWKQFTAALANPVTWKGLLFLLAKLPLGIVSFVMLVTFGSISAALIAAPIYYRYTTPQVDLNLMGLPLSSNWQIDTLPEAVTASLIGMLLLFLSLHLFNGLAWLSGKFARVMLGNFTEPAPAPVEVVAPISSQLAPLEAVAPAAPPAEVVEVPVLIEPAVVEVTHEPSADIVSVETQQLAQSTDMNKS